MGSKKCRLLSADKPHTMCADSKRVVLAPVNCPDCCGLRLVPYFRCAVTCCRRDFSQMGFCSGMFMLCCNVLDMMARIASEQCSGIVGPACLVVHAYPIWGHRREGLFAILAIMSCQSAFDRAGNDCHFMGAASNGSAVRARRLDRSVWCCDHWGNARGS